MPNVTLSVPADVLRAARIHAAERGTSVSGLVRDYLMSLEAKEEEFARLQRLQEELYAELDADPNHRFSAGDRLSRDELYDRNARRREAESARNAG